MCCRTRAGVVIFAAVNSLVSHKCCYDGQPLFRALRPRCRGNVVIPLLSFSPVCYPVTFVRAARSGFPVVNPLVMYGSKM